MKRFEMRVNAEASKPGAVLTVDEVLMELVDALQVMTLTGDKGPAEVALDDAGLFEHAAAISERPSSAARAIIGDRRRPCIAIVV